MVLVLLALLCPALAADEEPPPEATSEEAVMPPALLPDPEGDDPHLWLEDVLGEEPLAKVKGWNDATLAEMNADPRFQELKAEALKILTSDARLATGEIKGKDLYNFWQDPTHVRGIWRRTPLKAYVAGEPQWEVLLDVDALAEAEGENWIWGGVSCAPSSDRCLISLSEGGKDAHVVREFDRGTKEFVADGFTLAEAKSDVVFLDEDTVLLGTDTGEGSLTSSGYPRIARRWLRGQSPAEAEVLLEGEEGDVLVGAFAPRHRKDVRPLLYRARTFYDQDTWVLRDDGTKEPLPLPARIRVYGLYGDKLIVELHQDWSHRDVPYGQGQLIGVDLDSFDVEVIYGPSEGEAIEGVHIGKTSIFVARLSDVKGELLRFRPSSDGWQSTRVDLPDNGQVSIAMGSDESDDVFVTFESLTKPVTLFHVDKKDRLTELQALPTSYDASDVVVEQRFAESTDGTRVPYFLMARKDVLEGGPAPTIQYGYGGFLSSIVPTYFRDRARPQQGAFAGPMWVKDGGVLVLSNIRGGGEYGAAWHEAALVHDRQKAYDDFFAIAEDLIDDGVTTPDQLGAIGRSNGGLLMGVAFTQRPDLYAAIDCGVPLLDMLRYHELLAGASWVGEYGSPDVPEERATLTKISPYHNLQEGTDYPRILFYTSTRDDRVHPGHARKMAATLESMGQPFYYWENIEGGHGGVANQDQAALRIALEFLYFKRELGLD